MISFIQNLKTHLVNTQVYQKMVTYGGHGWTHIQNFPTYAQDRRIAAVSLVMANCIAFQIAKIATYFFQYLFPLSEERLEGNPKLTDKLVELTSVMMGFGITIGCVALFVTKAQLPFSPYATIGISVATIASCILLESSTK